MIRRVHSVASRVLVGLGVAVAALAAIGYAFIFSGIATPVARDLGTITIPDEDGAVPVYLADGRPAFLIRNGDGALVLDARTPLAAGAPGRLVSWCNGVFWDLIGTGIWAPDGALLAGDAQGSLVLYPTGPASSGRQAAVGTDGYRVAARFGESGTRECDAWEATMHTPRDGEVFDPSVAAEEEPPGWVWLEGRLEAIDGQALLCDAVGDCATGAVVRGIDPATVPAGETVLDGTFIGRIRDGAIDELHYVPLSEAGR
jgi:hypothetical protein